MAKFKRGDTVRVIKYGHLIWQSDGNGNVIVKDIATEVVGKTGIIMDVYESQPNFVQYSIDGIPGKTAWYNEDQLELNITSDRTTQQKPNMNNPLLYVPIEIITPEPGSHIIGFVKGIGTVYGRYLVSPFPQVVSNETQQIHPIVGWYEHMKENYCLFIKAEGYNKDGNTFRVWTSQKHQPGDVLYFVNYGIPPLWVREESLKESEHRFVSCVKWYSDDLDYHYDVSAIPKGEIIQCEGNHDMESSTT